VTTTGDLTTEPTNRRNRVTASLAVLAVLVTPFGLLTPSLLLPVGVIASVGALALAVLVLTRTTPGHWPRRFAWALVIFSLLPCAVAVAYFVWISFFDALPAGIPSSG